MGMTINWGSIRSKVDGFMDSPVGKKKIASSTVLFEKAMDTAEAAGQLMADMINSGIDGTGVLRNSRASLGSVQMIGEGRFRATVDIQGESSPSIRPEKFGGADNLTKLLNNGWYYSHPIRGTWGGHGTILSRNVFDGYHFVSYAVLAFPRSAYHVTNITVNNGWE